MSSLGFTGSYSGKDRKYLVRLSLLKFKEDGIVFIYSPSLDLTGYGKDGRSAKRSFEIGMEEFVHYTTNKGTLEKELKRLGWKLGGSKRKPKYEQPFLDELFSKRPYLGEIFRDKEFHRYEEEVAFPAA
jgi:hypothetical protein